MGMPVDDERQRRLDALHGLAVERSASGGSATPQTRRPGRSRWLILIAVGALLAAGGGYAATRSQRPTSPPTTASPSPSQPAVSLSAVSTFACAYPPAWSPRGDAYAIVGSTAGCAADVAGAPNSTSVVIISAATGAVLQRIPLAPYLGASDLSTCLADGAGAPTCPQVLLWSPDETKLAIGLVSVDAKGNPVATDALIINADSSGGFVLRGAGLAGGASAYTVFDLTDRDAKNLVTPVGLGAADVITWATDGTLTLQAGNLTAAIGNPDAGTAFAPWQPGFLTSAGAGVADFGAVFGAWSPDGRSVALTLTTHVQIPASTPPATPETFLPVVVRAPRDEALTAAINEAIAQPGRIASLSWSISGAYLFEVRCTGVRAASLAVRSTATGAMVASAQLAFGNATVACAQSGVVAAWSPEDNAILLVATASGTLAHWTPKLG